MLPLSSAAKWLRTKWLGSKSLRGLWGRIIDSPSPKRWSSPSERLLSIERLEDRTMLSVVPTVTGLDGDASGIAVVNAATPPGATSSVFSYLGYPALITGANQLTVFATGDIDLASFRPDYLQSQGIRSLVVQGSDATNDTLHMDLS